MGWRARGVIESKNTPEVSACHQAQHTMYSLPVGWEGKEECHQSVIRPLGSEVRDSGHQLLPRLCRFVAWERPSAPAPPPDSVSWCPNSLLDAGSAGSCAGFKSHVKIIKPGFKFNVKIVNQRGRMMRMQNVQSFQMPVRWYFRASTACTEHC